MAVVPAPAVLGEVAGDHSGRSDLRGCQRTGRHGERQVGVSEIWNRAWSWATVNRDMFAFINASLGAPWLTAELAARKATMTEARVGTYTRFELDTD